jgi:hypothetical protein
MPILVQLTEQPDSVSWNRNAGHFYSAKSAHHLPLGIKVGKNFRSNTNSSLSAALVQSFQFSQCTNWQLSLPALLSQLIVNFNSSKHIGSLFRGGFRL